MGLFEMNCYFIFLFILYRLNSRKNIFHEIKVKQFIRKNISKLTPKDYILILKQ